MQECYATRVGRSNENKLLLWFYSYESLKTHTASTTLVDSAVLSYQESFNCEQRNFWNTRGEKK